MTILHVTKKYPNALGGDAVVVSHLEEQQKQQGHAVHILTSNCPDIIRHANVTTFGLRDTAAALDAITPRRLCSLLALFWKSFGFLRNVRPDIIHTHSIDMAFAVSFAARLFRIPIVHTFHIVTFHDAQQSRVRRSLELRLARAAGLRIVTAPNEYDVAALAAAGSWQAQLLSNGVDLHVWRPAMQHADPHPFTFVSVGRLEHQKGYEVLLQAVAQLAQITPQPFRVVICGDGSLKRQLVSDAAQKGIGQLVDFVGRKSVAETYAIVSRADAAVFASLFETTPLTLLEAWAVGLPVITTRVGIVREKTDAEAAYLVAVGDVDALTKAMLTCMQDEHGRQQIANRGKQEAAQYAWPVIAQKAEHIYRGTL